MKLTTDFKKATSFLSIFFFFVTNSLATITLAEEIKIPEQELLIWRVDTKPGSLYSVYILGSYHVGKNCEINSPAFQHAFKDAENVVFEVDSIQNPSIYNEAQKSLIKIIREKGVPTNANESLKGILDNQTYELLRQKADAAEFSLENVADLKPWVFMLMYTSLMSQSEHKFECGLDSMIAQKAQAKNKDIAGLESLDYQFDKISDLYLSMDRDETLEALEWIAQAESTEEISEYFSQEIDTLTNSIDAGNVEYLESDINSWCQEAIEECESILLTRNRNWIPQIEELLEQKADSLVVVGAGHLVGEQSVIQLLKQKGYRVRRFYHDFRLTEEK